jgi:hypothetical protein
VITSTGDGEFTGRFQADNVVGNPIVVVQGSYFDASSISPEDPPFNSVVMVGDCPIDDVVAWLRWSPVEVLNNVNFNLNRLYVSAKTSTGRMCIATLASPSGGDVIVGL